MAAIALVSGMALAQAPVKVGVRGGFPLATLEASGKLSGLYVELLDAIAAKGDVKFAIDVLPFPRLRQYLKDGTLGAVLAIPNAEMLVDSVPVGAVMDLEVIALGRAGTRLESLEQMRGKWICLTRGSSLVPELYADKRYLLREVSRHESCPKMLDAGRVDFIISLPIGLTHLLARNGKSMADYGEPYLIKHLPVQLLVSRPHAAPALLHDLRVALDKAKSDGAIDQVQGRYKRTRG